MIYVQPPRDLPSHRFFEHSTPHSDLRKKIQHFSFLLNDRIGKGYSSTVYKGLNDLLHQQVAIKVIELRSLRDETSKSMLHTQIQCLRNVQHANVLKYIDSYFTTNNCYIITQYCPGSDLAKIMKTKGKIPEKEAAHFFRQIFSGYKAFHQAGYVHRDLKPANIFIGAEGSLKLADFGFSKKKTLIDRQNYNVGTPIYMPRQSLAANIYNEKTDVWAMGITLYEMIFGTVPFRGRTEEELRIQIQKGVLNFPPDVVLSADLKDFICQCLHTDSFKRMGVKEMERHPWLSSIISKPSLKYHDSPEKVEQENDLRTSLPHDGVLHNKSRQYFAGNQNRRSVCSVQKLKLCMPKKGSQNMHHRQPLADRTLNLKNINKKQKQCTQSLGDKQNKPQNYNITLVQTVQTQSTREGIKESNKAKESIQLGVEKIVSLINYFRLLYKILQKINTAQAQVSQSIIKTRLQQASRQLTDRLAQIFNKHLTNLSDRSNQFNFNSDQWITFATSERWQIYVFVIGRYHTKYADIIRKSTNREWESSNKILKSLWEVSQNGQLDRLLLRERYMYIQVLSLLSHLEHLDSIVNSHGWESFTQKYKNCEEILKDTLSVGIDNYRHIENQLSKAFQSNI